MVHDSGSHTITEPVSDGISGRVLSVGQQSGIGLRSPLDMGAPSSAEASLQGDQRAKKAHPLHRGLVVDSVLGREVSKAMKKGI